MACPRGQPKIHLQKNRPSTQIPSKKLHGNSTKRAHSHGPQNPHHITEICKSNSFIMDPSAITSAYWAKAIENRAISQQTAHLYLTFTNAETANRAITNGLTICNKKCTIKKRRKEPIRCLKCQSWNHIAKECIKDNDTCGNCAGQHRSNTCTTTNKKCVSCKAEDHASWSWQCPTFLKKLTDLNTHSLENSTLYFPPPNPGLGPPNSI